MFDRIIALCRPGFEKECAAELQAHAGAAGFAAYVKTVGDSGLVQLISSGGQCIDVLFDRIDFRQLIFTRQWFAAGDALRDLPDSQRTVPLLAHIRTFGLHFHDIELAHTDTNEGKALSKFCKSFRSHTLRALQQNRLLSVHAGQRLHLLFIDSHTVFVGFAPLANSNPRTMGIHRLKMPGDAPSRSTLKLEEALHTFITTEQQRQFIKAGMRAVDLGAAPGGWSWQLVQRGMLVTAIDNGPLADSLVQTGLVEHLRADAFHWQPSKAVDWLVCDMVERPQQVSRLIGRWFVRRHCMYSIFNLKLPMSKRYPCVVECLTLIQQTLDDAGIPFDLAARQLYHDREEITVFLRRLQPNETATQD